MDRWLCKLVACVVMLVIMLTVTLMPFRVISVVRRQGRRGQAVLLTLTCFTGGIFLGTCLLFLVPEVSFLIGSAVRRLLADSELVVGYPLGELIVGGGFFVVMFIERAVVDLHRRTPPSTTATCRQQQPQHSDDDVDDRTRRYSDEKMNFVDVEATAERHRTPSKSESGFRVRVDSRDSSAAKTVKKLPIVGSDRFVGSRRSLTPSAGVPDTVGYDLTAAVVDDDSHGAAKTVVFFVALSLDCFLGGLSLGLQRSAAAVWTVLVGILAHEAVVGFGLGLQLAGRSVEGPTAADWPNGAARVRRGAVVMATVYACVGPAGVLVGTAVAELAGSSQDSVGLTLVNGVLQGVATGVFIYVTFFELLDGKVNAASRYGDLVAILAGFGVMAAIAAVPQGGGPDVVTDALTTVSDSSVMTSLGIIE